MNEVSRLVLLALALLMAGGASQATGQVPVLPPAAPPPGALPLVAVDPGHGGDDPGAVGRVPAGTPTGLPVRGDGTRLYEKDVNLDVAQRLDALLRARGYPTLMTRTQDLAGGDRPFTGVRDDLRARVDAANAAGAGLFVSLHSNSHRSTSSGTETFHFYAGALTSRVLARAVHEELVARLGLPDRGVKSAGFYVLRHTRMPSILVEGGFLSNPAEAQVLARPEVRQLIAEGVAAGLDRYLRGGGPVGPVAPVAAAPTPVAAPAPARYWVTAGAFRRAVMARRLVRRVEARGFDAVVRGRRSARAGGRLYYVVTGQFAYIDNARRQRAQLRALRLPAKVASAVAKPIT